MPLAILMRILIIQSRAFSRRVFSMCGTQSH